MEEIDQRKINVPPHKRRVLFKQDFSWNDSQLRPNVQGDGTPEERHETDKEMDGVVQTKIFTMKFNDFRDIPMEIWKKIVGKG